MRGWASVAWLGSAMLLVLCLTGPATAGAFEIVPGGTTIETLNAAGGAESKAGGHPDRLVTGFRFSNGGGSPEGTKDLVVDLPPGLSGNPNAVPFCPRQIFGETLYGPECPPDSQVGVMRLGSAEGESSATPLFSVEPGSNELALFGAALFIPLKFVASLRSSDQGLSVRLGDVPQVNGVMFDEGEVELWGVPADHQEGTSIPRRPLLTTPTRCDGGPLSVTVNVRTWQQPDRWLSDSESTGYPLSGCGELPFDPRIDFGLGNPVADAPTGARIDLTIPQNDDPGGRAASQTREAGILLPEGMTISPGGAEGLGFCGDAQFGLGAAGEPACPALSRVGSVEMAAPQFAKPLVGGVYLGQEHPGDRFRLFMVARGGGAEAKLAGSLHPDPETGRLTANLTDLPQTAFERISLKFDGGPGALLATPAACGPAATAATFTPYSGNAPVTRTGSVGIAGAAGAPCAGPPPFAPAFSGGGTRLGAGRTTALAATIRRSDGEQLPERLTIALPAGMSAALGSVDPCGGAAAGNGACSASSRIGAVLAELGPGANPVRLEGSAYLTGPYRRAPFGVALAFPAKVGPFDLGTLVVRGALRVDPLSGAVTIETDPLPRVVGGIAVRFQTIALEIDRPGFLRNPTSCAPESLDATVSSSAGAVSRTASPFRAQGCVSLPFHPAFAMALTNPSQFHAHGRPGLRISARMPAGGANLRTAEIGLPPLLRFDSSGLREICARRAAGAGNCPKGSQVGTGHARAPLLGVPLKGPLYIVQPRDAGTPDLWADLKGGGVRMALRTETSESHGRVATKLRELPDFPLASFAMSLAAGEHGVLSLKPGVCAGGKVRRPLTPIALEGQNGALRRDRIRLSAPGRCGDE